MKLTLLIPGLIWPESYDGIKVCQGVKTAALEYLFTRGTICRRPIRLSTLLTAPWGGDMQGLAAWMAQEMGYTTPANQWLLADPIYIQIERDQARPMAVVTQSAAAKTRLTQDLNRHFAELDWQFHAIPAAGWLLELAQPIHTQFSSLPDVLGENMLSHLPWGNHALKWHSWMNEVQMLLHQHPCNHTSTLPLNGLWFWGEGKRPKTAASAVKLKLFSNDPWQRWMSEHSEAPCYAVPDHAAQWLENSYLDTEQATVYLSHLQIAAQQRDSWRWRDALQQLEQDWIHPVLLALDQGRIQHITLLAHGQNGVQLQVGRRARWKYWRRPRTLASLLY